ncbi:MAG TPA: AMP-binding protein [Candidatus Limnocylindria bacterium]|nr:AMP-binding protein [Candidatus Limnocylindria bacterium]
MTGPLFGTDTDAAAWRPSPAYLGRSRLARFLRAHGCDGLEALQARAVADPAWFWGAAVADIGVRFDPEPGTVLDTTRGIEWARWFSGAGFNYVRMAVDEPAAARPDELALAWEGEDGEVRRFTRAQLRWAVDRAARAMASLGVERGDRVGIFLPMIPEAVVAVLAVGKLGAIYTPIFSGYGADAVASRLADCEATLLVTADGFARRGKPVPMKATADEALAHAPSVLRSLVVRHTGAEVAWDAERDVWWDAAVTSASAEPLETVATDANDPFMIIYTSGTTGRPKGALHVHGGFPIKAAVDLAHGFDLQAGDILFWFTDMGWMMGPWAVAGAPMLGATLFIYEGTPDYPGPDRLWGLVERHRITHLGISPTLVRALMTHGSEPPGSHDLSSLLVLGSTGEPWNPDPWWWLFRAVGGERLPIINYSGGTEISGGILGCTTLSPIAPCSFSGPSPGMAADVVDANGQPLRGEVGELVIRQPWPGMTQGFWNDRERYLEAYWSRLPGVWVHGDWARIDEAGYWYISGRSDDTIKVAGKRIGPAEVESAAVAHPVVVEALAVGVPDELKGESIVVFAVVRDSAERSERLAVAISDTVVEHLGKSFRPGVVHLVPSLPRTRNGKILRRLARSAYLGLDPGDVSSIEDASTLEPIRQLRGR